AHAPLFNQSKAPVALRVVQQGFVQLLPVEVGPVDCGEVVFGIGTLPDQEVAQAEFPACADDQIRVGQVASVEVMADQLLGDLLRLVAMLDNLADGVDDLRAPAVVEGHVEDEPVVVLGQVDGMVDLVPQFLLNFGQVTKVAKLYALLVELVQLAVDDITQDGHQPLDFFFGAAPVLRREGVNGEDFDAELHTGPQDLTQIFGSCPVTGDAGQPALTRPAPIAIHNNGDVRRHFVGR